jgi:hypothetical protein
MAFGSSAPTTQPPDRRTQPTRRVAPWRISTLAVDRLRLPRTVSTIGNSGRTMGRNVIERMDALDALDARA